MAALRCCITLCGLAYLGHPGSTLVYKGLWTEICYETALSGLFSLSWSVYTHLLVLPCYLL
ncbi:hypothetical protein BT96DRAFT_543360 [Gymnopus androsaceus JB14]|uniref:Uncharacterized protein n=1 Tax=Gymnopus androsaceus JB14 TaxID=1447944 RepID=A0A6A4HWM3_9AGAR|nr:hypothetical protein BT96DRAFT_543360 [Gymnopus androsaceus JB14]